jgi:oligosaccharide repeat unit polymerase
LQALRPYKPEAYSPSLPLPAAAEQSKAADSPFLSVSVLYRAAIIAAYAAILLTIILNVEVSSKAPVFVLLCLALVLNFSIVLLPIVFYKPSYGLFHPLVFDCCLYLLFQVRSYSTYLAGLGSHRALPTWGPEEILQLVAYALVLKSIATASYFFGFFFGPNISIPRLSFPKPHNIPLKATALVCLSLLFFFYYIQLRGGVEAHLLSWQEGRHNSMAGEGYWHLMIKVSMVASLLWFTLDRRAPYKPLFWLCSAVAVYINFIATGSRSMAVFAIMAGLFIWMLREKKIAPTRIAAVGVVSVVLIGLLGSYREQIWKGDTSWSTTTEGTSFVDHFLEGAEESGERAWSGNALLPIIALVPDQVEMLYGSSYLSVVTLPIPRDLWSDKPGQIGGRTGEVFFHSPAGVPPGAIGEAFWNFHIPGVIFIFFLYGTFHKWMAQIYLRYSGKAAMILIYLTVLYMIEPTTPAIVSGLLVLVPAFVIMRLIGVLRFS